jgi:Flp pilus assembly protein TadD
LGLLKARTGRQNAALDLFAKAAALQPATARYAYVYGVALHSYGDVGKAISVLLKAHERSPADRDILMALITFHRDMGDVRSAATYADQLVQVSPGDMQAIALRNSLNPPTK